MKKYFKLIFILILSLGLTACSSNRNLEITDKIRAPKNIKPPLEGRWEISSYKLNKKSTLTDEAARTYLGKEVLVDSSLVSVSTSFTLEPNFKVKEVKAEDYLIYQYKIHPKFLDLDKEQIQVVSITGSEQFFYEFIVLDEKKALINIDGVFFTINKLEDRVDRETIAEFTYKSKDKGSLSMVDGEEDTLKKTGILLGLKAPDQEEENTWNYRTIFLRFDNRKVKGSYDKENLFVPRKNGFWTISLESEKDGEGKTIAERVLAEPSRIALEKEASKELSEPGVPDDSLKNIIFLSNNYISIENTLPKDNIKYLDFFPIDSLNKGKPLSITDLTGEQGSKLFAEGMNKDSVVRANKDLIDKGKEALDEKNFGLFRRNGHWILKGRVNYKKDSKNIFRDFYIKTVLSDDVVGYDQLNIPWYSIKLQIPEAVDAFVSPNEDIIIVKTTTNNLLVYGLDKGDIGDIPIMKIELEAGETVVMKEWAKGRYANVWEEEFLKGQFNNLSYK